MVSLSEAQVLAWISPWLWAFFRVLGLFTTAPVISMRMVPRRVRVGLALFLLNVFTLDGRALSVLTLYRQVWLQCHHGTLVLRQCRAG